MAVRDIRDKQGRRSEGQRMLDEEDMVRGEGDRILRQDNQSRREAEERSLGSLLSELADEMSTLFRKEVELVKIEASESAGKAKTGVMSLAVGGVLAFAGLLVLMMAAAYGLSAVMHPGWAALIVGAAGLIIGGVIAMIGASKLKPANLTPERTQQTLREDVDFAREKINGK